MNTISDRLSVLTPNRYGLHLVRDEKSREYHELYRPFTPAQLAAGHVEGRWYHRLTTWTKDHPASPPYATLPEALAGLASRQELKDLIDGRNPQTPAF